MTDTRKVQLGAEFDASGVRKGTQEAKDAVRDMARDVQASGQQAAKGLEGMGKGATDAAQKIERDTRSIAASIQRATAAAQAGEKGTAAYFEQLAKARGANLATLQPYIDQLRQAERAQQAASASLGAMGVSAAQTRAALRQLPAQFTDIFTSLSSGQAPLTVLIQQGGQIKDSFGGIGAALRGVAGAISPVALGLGALAAAVGAVGLAYAKGSAEADEYRRALVLSGNAVGTTTAALADAAARVSQGVGTQGQAAAVLAQLAGTGRVAAADLELVTEAAIRLQREGGPAVKDTVAAFAELGKAPTAGALKLNESTRFLTVEILEQIRALEEQGRTFEAARVAQQAYAQTAIDRARELERGLGTLERAWRGVADGAKSAWDFMLGIGRAQTPQQRLAEIQDELDSNRAKGLGRVSIYGSGPGRNEQLTTERGAINRGLINQSERTAEQRANALLVEEYEKARKANERWAEAAVSNTEKVNKALDEYRRNLATINEGRARAKLAPVSDAEVRAQEAAIRRSILGTKELSAAERERQLVLESSRDAAKQWADAITDFQGIQAKAEAGADNLNEAQRRVVQLLSSQAWKQASEPMRQLAIQSFTAANNALEHAEAEKQRAKALADAEAASKRYLQGIDREIDTTQRQIELLEDEYVELTQGKAAREARVQQRLDDAAAMARQVANGALWLDGLTEETQRLMKLAEAQQVVADGRRRNTGAQQANDAADQARKAVEEARRESERWMADLQSGLTDVFRQAFLAGGNFGKNFARGLAAEVQARLATALATVLAEAILGLGVRAAGALVGAAGGSGSGWGNVLQGASLAKDGYNLYTGGSLYAAAGNYAAVYSGAAYGTGFGTQQSAMLAAQEAGMVSQAGSSTMATWGTWAGWAALIALGVAKAIGDYGDGFRRDQARDVSQEIPLGRFLGDFALFGGIEATKANFLSQLGFSDMWADLLSGSTAIAKTFGRSAPRLDKQGVSGTITGGDFTGQAFADIVEKGGIFRSDKRYTRFAELPDDLGRLLDQGATKVFGEAKRFGEALGLPASQLAGVTTQLRVEFAKPENDSKEAIAEATKKNIGAIAEALGQYGDDLVNSWTAAVKPLMQVGESTAQTIQRVGTAILGVNDVLNTLGLTALQASVDGGKAALALQELFGGIDNLRGAGGSFLANFYSDEERKSLTLKGIGDVLDDVGLKVPATRDAFRDLVEAQDLTTDAGRKAFAALMGVADAFASVVPAAEDAGAALAAAAQRIAGEREDLQAQLWRLQGNDQALRDLERSKISPENLGLYDQIQLERDKINRRTIAEQEAEREAALAIERARAAAAASEAYWRAQEEAAAQVQRAWAGVWSSIEDEITRLRGGVVGNKGQAYASAQAQFAVQLANAQAGSVDAARELPGLSKLLDEMMTERAASAVEVALSRARLIASLQTVPRYASGGYHPGGARLVGERGPEVEVTGPSRIYNEQQLSQALGTAELRQEIRALRADMLQAQATIAGYTQRSAQALERALPDGDAFAVRVTP